MTYYTFYCPVTNLRIHGTICMYRCIQVQPYPPYDDSCTEHYVDSQPAGLSGLEDEARLQLINRCPLNGNLAVSSQRIARLNNRADTAAEYVHTTDAGIMKRKRNYFIFVTTNNGGNVGNSRWCTI